MKLDYKKTLYVGIAFFIITIFWQAYDTVIARILIDKFGLNQFWSGVIMAIDNILALFLLPLFGALSDKSNAKRGKRTHFIIIGTVVAAMAFMGLTLVDNLQSKTLKASSANVEALYEHAFVKNQDNPNLDVNSYEHWIIVIEGMDVQQDKEVYQAIYTDVDHKVAKIGQISESDKWTLKEAYYEYLSDRARAVTMDNKINLVLFMGVLLIALVAMATFRSPAVALMPDVTIKPLRSKANAIINLMGSAAAVIALLLLMVTKRDKLSYVSYAVIFIPIGVIMLVALGLYLKLVDEKKLVEEKLLLDQQLGLIEEENEEEIQKHKTTLSKEKFKSLILILVSVFLWFMGYNAVISKVSDYAPKVLNMGSAFPTMIAHGTAIAAFIPIGIISSKIGRKKAVLIGIVILSIAFGSVFFLNENSNWLMYLVFALIGIGWATINVNSYPMVVELSKGSDVGRYTGYYYTFSMAAQIVTPMLSGLLMTVFDRRILFPYATIFIALAFITMIFVKHGNAEVIEKKSLLEHMDVD